MIEILRRSDEDFVEVKEDKQRHTTVMEEMFGPVNDLDALLSSLNSKLDDEK
jgi:hypothetical protein